VKRLRAALDDRKEAVERALAELEQVRMELTDVREELDAAAGEAARRSEEADAARSELAQQAARAAALEQELGVRSAEASRLRADLASAERAQESGEAERARLRRELQALSQNLNATLAELARTSAHARTAELAAARRSGGWRAVSQFLSWILKPTPRRLGYARRYLELRKWEEFDAGWYAARYPDIAESGLHPLMHYVEHGEREGREATRPAHEDVEPRALPTPEPESPAPALRAPVRWEALDVRPPLEDEVAVVEASGLFDEEYYCATYPDVLDSDFRPVEHFCVGGWREGRRPNAYFDPEWYLRTYPEVAASGVNPLWHYVAAGEDRRPSALFDPHFYLRSYGAGDAPGALADYLAHARTGRWRNPVDLFDADFYLARNDDVRESGKDPVFHYLHTGHAEGRDPSPRFSTVAYRTAYLQGRRDVNPLVHYYETAAGMVEPSAPQLLTSVSDEIRRWTNPGDEFEDLDPTLAAGVPGPVKALAFYLPQFHAIPENDRWWGKGFTEWRNVMRGAPRFAGHYQPRVPRDLGFYDLTDPDVMRAQVELARAAGLHGFAFYYYWFNGKRLLERPLEQFLGDALLDFPFCLMWANENWTRRWDGKEDEVLLAQDYRREDDAALVDDFQRHFDDPRYIRLDGRPLLLVYRLDSVPDARATVRRWRRLWRSRHGEKPLIFLAQGFGTHDPREFDLDGAIEFPPHKVAQDLPPLNAELTILDPGFTGHVVDYEDVVERSLREPYPEYPLIKTAVPAWDNDARRQGAGMTLHGSTPAQYERWLRGLAGIAREHPVHGESLVFVNAWNEWAEAAYLEPDVHYGSANLNATARALAPRGTVRRGEKRKVLFVGHDAHPHGAQINVWHMGEMMRNQFGCEVAYLLLAGGVLLSRYEELGRTFVADDDPRRTRAFLRELRDDGYAMAVTNTAASGVVVPELEAAGFRVVSLIHELPGVIQGHGLEPALEQILRRSDIVVVPADVVAEAIRPYGDSADADKIVIRPQGLYHHVDDSADARERVRRRLGVDKGGRVVLNVGFADERKGIDIFLRVAERAAVEAPHLRFVWVGNLHLHVEERLAEAGGPPPNVHFVPFTKDVSDHYAACDVFFLTSREDPFPAVVLEAMSIGRPVVAFHGSGGIEQLVAAHGTLVDRDEDAAAVAALEAAAEKVDLAASDERRRVIAEQFRFDDYCFFLLRLLDERLRKVSVVVPNFDYARYLEERLTSIFEQTYPIFELIVLDDASRDHSLEVLERLSAATGRRFRVLVNEVNSGVAFRQWAKGCEAARGECVWIAEADDLSRPRFLERVVDALEDGGAALGFSDSAQVDEDGRELGDTYRWYYSLAAGATMESDFVLAGGDFVRRCLAERNLVLNMSAVVWDRAHLSAVLAEQLDAVTGFRLAGDWLLYAAAALRAGARVAYVAEALNIHRRHRRSVTGALEKRKHLDEVARVQATLADWIGADEETRARMAAYQSELAEMFGLANGKALQAS
jgi:glycosyltransferase involved in cell wall biosynthesis